MVGIFMNSNHLPYKPKIRDIWYVIPTAKYVLFRGNGIFKVIGENLKEFLEVILPLLNGSYTLDEILDILSEYHKEDILSTLNNLNNHGILDDASVEISASMSRKELEHYHSNLRYFMRFSNSKYQYQCNLKKARVIILGSNELAYSIAEYLVEVGVGKVLLICDKKIDTSV